MNKYNTYLILIGTYIYISFLIFQFNINSCIIFVKWDDL